MLEASTPVSSAARFDVYELCCCAFHVTSETVVVNVTVAGNSTGVRVDENSIPAGKVTFDTSPAKLPEVICALQIPAGGHVVVAFAYPHMPEATPETIPEHTCIVFVTKLAS